MLGGFLLLVGVALGYYRKNTRGPDWPLMKCGWCGGKGTIHRPDYSETCPSCNGTGLREDPRAWR